MASLATVAANVLWYSTPAEKWMEAMPIGNGRLSGMVFGGIDTETIALNEISMWSGGYDSTANELCGPEALAEMRRAFFSDDPELGNALGEKYLNGHAKSFGTHVPLGNVKFSISNPSSRISDYRRELDMDNAIARVSYTSDGVDFSREVIASWPDSVIAIRFAASQPGMINVGATLDLLRDAEVVANGNTLSYNGKVSFHMHGPGGVEFAGAVRFVPEGGAISAADKAICVEGADALTVLIDLRTNYNRENYAQAVAETIDKAQNRGWEALKSAHVADYTALFSRVKIDLGPDSGHGLPTDVRLRLTKQGVTDPGFDALFFQYGRYMLISSSRPNGMPLCANLQGIWNDNGACNMPWTCDYHLDINTQQNYWSANRANLGECNQPLFGYLGLLARHGADTAAKVYGCRGWVAHTVANVWGYTAPGWGVSWGMNVTGGAWLATHLWSHYLYTLDKDYLRSTAYPILKGCAEFFKDYMVVDPGTGYLVTGPSVSPENGYVSPKGNHLCLDMMPTVDRAMVYDIYTAVIESSKILGVDKKLRKSLEKDIAKLPPIANGSDGQVKEWLGDVRRSDPSHRHSSHLLAVFPLNQITVGSTPDLIEGARKGLALQTSSPNWEDTEWSTANMMCLHARMKDSEMAYGWLQNLFKTFTRENLMTVSPAGIAMAEYDIFSFDATEASVAGICEMLLQSHDGFVELLPALPDAWAEGHVAGICAEGALTADIEWSDKLVKHALLTAGCDNRFRLLLPEGREAKFSVNGKPATFDIHDRLANIELKKGDRLQIEYSL